MAKMRLNFDLDKAIRDSASAFALGDQNRLKDALTDIGGQSDSGDSAFYGGRRVSATGAIFKRELKTSDSIQGSSIVDTPVAPQFGDIYDGQAAFFPALER